MNLQVLSLSSDLWMVVFWIMIPHYQTQWSCIHAKTCGGNQFGAWVSCAGRLGQCGEGCQLWSDISSVLSPSFEDAIVLWASAPSAPSSFEVSFLPLPWLRPSSPLSPSALQSQHEVERWRTQKLGCSCFGKIGWWNGNPWGGRTSHPFSAIVLSLDWTTLCSHISWFVWPKWLCSISFTSFLSLVMDCWRLNWSVPVLWWSSSGRQVQPRAHQPHREFSAWW